MYVGSSLAQFVAIHTKRQIGNRHRKGNAHSALGKPFERRLPCLLKRLAGNRGSSSDGSKRLASRLVHEQRGTRESP